MDEIPPKNMNKRKNEDSFSTPNKKLRVIDPDELDSPGEFDVLSPHISISETLRILEDDLVEDDEDDCSVVQLREEVKNHEERINVLERTLSLLAHRVGVTSKSKNHPDFKTK